MNEKSDEVREALDVLSRLKENGGVVSTLFLWILTIILVVLKMMGVSQISWFWSLFPLLLPIYIVLGFIFIFAVIIIGMMLTVGIATAMDSNKKGEGE